MYTAWFSFAIVLFINAIADLIILSILIRRPQKPGIHSMSMMLWLLAVWSFSYAMITLSPQHDAKVFWLKVENFGIQLVPVFWFLFSIKYTRMDSWVKHWAVYAVFFIIPLISLSTILSKDWFPFYYSSVHTATENGGPLVISRGPVYWVALVESYLLYLTGLVVLVIRFIRSRAVYRRQTPYLIGAVVVPFVVNLAYQLRPDLIQIFPGKVDLTPLSFTISSAFLAASIFGLRLLDIVPIARDTVMEHIPEMVFVLDDKERIIDANAVAQKWLGKPMQEIIGREPIEVFRHWPQLLQRFFFLEHIRDEIELPGEPPRTLETIITPILNRANQVEGRIILAYDITDRKNLEKDLKKANESLQVQLNENERLRLQLQEQAMRDPLTGVFNRRYFAESLDNETARAAREHTPFSIIILDVDHFKHINDTYGHKCGDMVLQTLAKFLLQNTRRSDIVCRFGGEEFVVLMPDASTEAAMERAIFLKTQFALTSHHWEGHEIRVTFSAGVASFPAHALSGENLLGLADQALYQSKETGRNRVTQYGQAE